MTEIDGEKKMPMYASLAVTDSQITSRLRDPAKGGYFTAQDLRATGHEHDYHVHGYVCNGNHLLSTWHIGDHSMQMECDVWRGRGATQKALDSKNILITHEPQLISGACMALALFALRPRSVG